MSDNMKKMVEEITPMDVDFAKWYTDIVKKADLADYSSVKGCMIVRPYGTAIWENIRNLLDDMFKETGHENVMMPMFIPESLLQKEKDHVEGFAPEVAWVTHGGDEKLTERLCIRPTSEVLFCEHFKNIIHSYRDLPVLYNQWCSICRWEKTTRPFLRTTEFWWQEGHTMHETKEDALAETEQQLEAYTRLSEEFLAIPVIKGRKSDKEKFAGADRTYTIEGMMHDGKSLQCATSHYLGTGFAKAFDITFQGRENKPLYPHQTSWGMTTRMIGAIIMTHGDNNGLVLPPAVAPIQAIIIPVAQHKPGVLDAANELKNSLKGVCRVKVDSSDNSPGWKYAEYEMKGVPIRIELGPKDIEKQQCVLVTRHNRQKHFIPLTELNATIPVLLKEVHDSLYERALENRRKHTFSAANMDEIIAFSKEQTGFLRTMWCQEAACELAIKEQAGLSSRCTPFEQEKIGTYCAVCGKPADTMAIWGKAY